MVNVHIFKTIIFNNLMIVYKTKPQHFFRNICCTNLWSYFIVHNLGFWGTTYYLIFPLSLSLKIFTKKSELTIYFFIFQNTNVLLSFKTCLPYITDRFNMRRFTVVNPYTDSEVMKNNSVQLIKRSFYSLHIIYEHHYT